MVCWRGKCQLVSGTHHIEPFICTTFSFRDQPRTRSSGHRQALVNYRVLTLWVREELQCAGFFQFGDVGNPRWTKGMQFEVGKHLFQIAEKALCSIPVPNRDRCPLEVKLFASQSQKFLHLGLILIKACNIMLLRAPDVCKIQNLHPPHIGSIANCDPMIQVTLLLRGIGVVSKHCQPALIQQGVFKKKDALFCG